MKPISRRHCLKQISLAAAAASLPVFVDSCSTTAANAGSPSKPTAPELGELDDIAKQFLEHYKAPGLSVAIGRRGRIVYANAFGVADKSTGERETPAHLFRICSVAKPITSAAIYTLI